MNGVAHLLLQHLLVLLAVGAGAALLAVLVQVPLWLLARLSGPARDWPLLADRLARALERREALDEALGSLWLQVGAATRERIDLALTSEETAPGRRLVAAGLVPAAQAAAIAAAPAADLPALLRLSAHERGDEGILRLRSQMVALALALVLFTAWQLSWCGPMLRLCRHLLSLPGTGRDLSTGTALIEASQAVAIGLCAVAAAAAGLWALGRRRGWWERLAGWDALARALMLRRLLAAGERESACATALAAVWPRLAARLHAAGARGDLGGLLAAAGWRADSPAGLERAIGRDLDRRRRRGARLVLLAALLLPAAIAAPVGLAGGGIMLAVTSTQAPLNAIASRGLGGVGGSLSMAYLWRLLPPTRPERWP